MGVAIGRAQWSYTGFNAFRRRLAAVEGIHLDSMHGFVSDGIPWGAVSTPLVPLLDHSDCEGDLSPEECAQVWPRLLEIVEAWSDVEFGDDPQSYYDRCHGLLLAAEMREHAERGERLEFH